MDRDSEVSAQRARIAASAARGDLLCVDDQATQARQAQIAVNAARWLRIALAFYGVSVALGSWAIFFHKLLTLIFILAGVGAVFHAVSTLSLSQMFVLKQRRQSQAVRRYGEVTIGNRNSH